MLLTLTSWPGMSMTMVRKHVPHLVVCPVLGALRSAVVVWAVVVVVAHLMMVLVVLVFSSEMREEE
eukprot:882911-Prorocentrum_lima.AAC.1